MPSGTIGHDIGEHSRKQLTAEQESLFSDEIDKWITEVWLTPHDAKEHGQLYGCSAIVGPSGCFVCLARQTKQPRA